MGLHACIWRFGDMYLFSLHQSRMWVCVSACLCVVEDANNRFHLTNRTSSAAFARLLKAVIKAHLTLGKEVNKRISQNVELFPEQMVCVKKRHFNALPGMALSSPAIHNTKVLTKY